MDTAETFEACIGQVFTAGDGPHALELIRVERMANAGLPGHQPFTLIFQGPPGAVLAEGVHRFQTAGGQITSFHIMPIHTTARERQDYQAVFN